MTDKERLRIEKDTLKFGLLQFRKVDQYLLKNIEDTSISLGHKKHFNDPFDCSLPIDTDAPYQTVLKSIRYTQGHKNNHKLQDLESKAKDIFENQSKVAKDFENLIFEHRRFSCFTLARPNKHLTNSLFWANYADKHTGICIKYSGEWIKMKIDTGEVQSSFIPVSYTKTEEIPVVNYFENKVSGKRPFAEYCMLTKSPDWKHEEELRMIYFSKEKIAEPYIYIEVPPHFIKEVYLGCNFNFQGTLEKKLINTFKLPKYWGIKFYILRRNPLKFTLYPDPIKLEINQIPSLPSE